MGLHTRFVELFVILISRGTEEMIQGIWEFKHCRFLFADSSYLGLKSSFVAFSNQEAIAFLGFHHPLDLCGRGLFEGNSGRTSVVHVKWEQAWAHDC